MDKIIYNISSHNRPETLIKTIDSIYNQCDLINIVLNNYEEIPDSLLDNKINIFFADNEKGDAYKFIRLESSDGYFLTIDDDLIYPKNYSDYMIGKVEQYSRKSIITLHGKNFSNFPIEGFYNRNGYKLFHFKNELTSDVKVQFGGTGVMCFHTDLLKLPIEYFSYPNMADVWVGKYVIENNLDMICVEHPENFVIQQEFQDSIYNDGIKNDKIQTKLVNEIFSEKKISVIIPTFNNTNYINDCLDSVVKSMRNLEGEILVGVDSCQTTLDHIMKNSYDSRVKFYYFDENVGPYIIRNSLSEITKSNLILFFDSDDIMDEGLIDELIRDYDYYDFSKIQILNFNHGENYKKISRKGRTRFGEGVFAIKKDIFFYLNGFEPWRCAADSEFKSRLYKNNYRYKATNDIGVYRRIHSDSITMKSDTSYNSELRRYYIELSNKKTNFGPLEKLSVENFRRVVSSSYISSDNDEKIETPKPKIETQQNMLLSFLEKKTNPQKTTIIDREKIIEKRNFINSFNRFTPPKQTKRK